MNILVLNAGSSSVKFQLIGTDELAIANDAEQRLARGQIERIGGEAILTLAATNRASVKTTAPIRDHGSTELILVPVVATRPSRPA